MGTEAYGINDRGVVVGVYEDNNGRQHGFVYKAGTFTPVDVPLSLDTQARGINNHGDIVGFFRDNIGTHGFVYNGEFTSIDVPFLGTIATSALGINDRKQIVGDYNDGKGVHGYLSYKGTFTKIDVKDSYSTTAFRINNRGQVVGRFQNASGQPGHGFLYKRGVFNRIDVPFPSTFDTAALGLSENNHIVGIYQSGTPNAVTGSHGFVFTGRSFATIEVPGGINPTSWDINNRGQIVGDYVDVSNRRRRLGFLATPNPQ
jgi:probable HAF family extracellular repeat protein